MARFTKGKTEMTGNLFTRDDTIFGVCEGIGQDFGVNANLIRLGLAIGLLASPVAVIAIYAAMGAGVLVSRYAFPKKAKAAAETQPIEAHNDDHQVEYAVAA